LNEEVGREFWKVRTRKHKILGRKKARAPSQADSRQQPMHSGIGDLASRLVFGNAAERPRAFGSPSVLQKLVHAVESQAFDKSRVDIGTMSAWIGIRLSARTMAGAHITEATPPTKMRLRVSIEPPNINVSEITLQLSEVTRPNACYS
jgi:hypothetical protein